MTPKFFNIDKTSAVFTDSTITYSAADVTYSSSSTRYGGSDPFVDLSPKLSLIEDTLPVQQTVKDIVPIIQGISTS